MILDPLYRCLLDGLTSFLVGRSDGLPDVL